MHRPLAHILIDKAEAMKRRKKMGIIEFMTGEAPRGGLNKSSAAKNPPPGKSPMSRHMPNALSNPASSKPKRKR